MRWIVLALLAVSGHAAELKPETSRAVRPLHPPDRAAAGRPQELSLGGRVARPRRSGRARAKWWWSRSGQAVDPGAPSGLMHDWVGTVFLPGVSLERTLAMVQDYPRHKEVYKPEVVDSRILSHEDNHYRIFLRLLKKQVITVVLDTEHDVQYVPIDATRWRSKSRTTRISQVEKAGKPDEKVLPRGHRRRLPVAAQLLLAFHGARRRHVGGVRGRSP